MRISIFPAVLSLIVAAVLAWLAYDISFDEQSDLDVYVTIGTGISVLMTLGTAMACKLNNRKVGVSLKVWGALMFIIMVISNFCFAGLGVKMPWYVVVTACLLVLHVGVAWSLLKMKYI